MLGVNHAVVVIVVPCAEHIHRGEHFETIFMPCFDEFGKIVEMGGCTLDFRCKTAVVEHVARYGSHIHNSVGEAEGGDFLHVVIDAVGIAEAAVVGFGIYPHERGFAAFGCCDAEWSRGDAEVAVEVALVIVVVAVAHLNGICHIVVPHFHFAVAVENCGFGGMHFSIGIDHLEAFEHGVFGGESILAAAHLHDEFGFADCLTLHCHRRCRAKSGATVFLFECEISETAPHLYFLGEVNEDAVAKVAGGHHPGVWHFREEFVLHLSEICPQGLVASLVAPRCQLRIVEWQIGIVEKGAPIINHGGEQRLVLCRIGGVSLALIPDYSGYRETFPRSHHGVPQECGCALGPSEIHAVDIGELDIAELRAECLSRHPRLDCGHAPRALNQSDRHFESVAQGLAKHITHRTEVGNGSRVGICPFHIGEVIFWQC